MPKGVTFDNDLLKLLLLGTTITGLAQNTTSGPLTNLYLGLHTADPSSGNQSTNELTYTGYARVAVARSTSGWTITGNSAALTSTVSFGQRTDNGAIQTAYWFSVGAAASGATEVYYSGPIGFAPRPFTAAVTGNLFTSPAHGYSNGDQVFLVAGSSGSLPTGFTAGTIYYVISSATDTFQLSATSGGAAIAVTASGDGLVTKFTPLTIGQNTVPQLTTATTITES